MPSFPKTVCLVLSLVIAWRSAKAIGEQPPPMPHVPQTLLKLIHTPEVQRELGLLSQEPALRAILEQVDGPWWRSRNLPEEQQRQTVAQLEQQLLSELRQLLPVDKIRRLREIETQAQGTRSLLRPAIAKAIGLTSSQQEQLRIAFVKTDTLARTLAEKPSNQADAEQELLAARQAEQQSLNGLLTQPQRVALGKLLGEPFDTTGLQRIYPLAPELIDSGHWTTDAAIDLTSHRGKVLLIHFYAFQCHNCIANFEHYKRWHAKLAEQGVQVIGIQTPETSAERDARLVKAAAKERGFEFPVLIDLEHKNWDAWGNTMWPTVYVVDKRGYIRSWWQGELNWQGATGDKSIEKLVDQLLVEE